MQTYILLLRGVMPTGKNKVPMATLRQILTDAGYEDVRTWIQSGNVVVSTKDDAKTLSQHVRKLIQKQIGADIAVVVKTPKEIDFVLKQMPFKGDCDPARVFYTLFNGAPQQSLIEQIRDLDYGDEKLYVTPQAAYLYIPGSAARSKLSNNYIEKKLRITATTRNYNTLSKLLAMSAE